MGFDWTEALIRMGIQIDRALRKTLASEGIYPDFNAVVRFE